MRDRTVGQAVSDTNVGNRFMSQSKTMLLLSVSLVSALMPGVCYAQGGEASHPKAESVTVKRCSVSLKNHVVLATDRPGVLASVGVKTGDRPQQDEVVAQLKNQVATAQLDIAKKEASTEVRIRFAETSYELAKTEYLQAKQTNENRQVLTAYEILRAKHAMDQAEIEVEIAKHEHELNQLRVVEAQERLNEYQLVSPFAGIVTRVYHSKGEAVQQGDPVVEILDPDTLIVEGYLSVRDSIAVRTGDRVEVRLSNADLSELLGQPTFKGTVQLVDIPVQPVTETIRIVAEVANEKEYLRPGFDVEMKVNLNTAVEPVAKAVITQP